MHVDLATKTAVVTGSSTGIGLAIATELARAGASVVLTGRNAERLENAANRLTEQLPDANLTVLATDLATEEGAGTLRDNVPDADILVNNLGIFGARPPLEIADDEWRTYFETNVLSAIRLIRTYLPGMINRGWGRVLNISSESGIAIPAEMIHYGTTKTSLLAVSRGFAKEAAGTGVTVNSVIVGPTHTGGVEDFVYELVDRALPWEQAQREFMRLHRPNSLIQRLIEPEEVAHMVVYLSSPQASATTGAAARVDGGCVDSIIP
ncbi:SDR family NAD(P)-dependent oxidoreductase [Streptomyces sp. NPDC051956]|uniref:SDR family NAD(P)-dependent oxidoreductase n=1 Tax=Streptomyces sp. NPDC051956 TaxID=3365677 RepID=UPI0037CF6E41